MTPPLTTKPKAIFFDWDGTLVDSFALILAAHNHACQTLNMPLFDVPRFTPYFGMPREQLYADIYGANAKKAQGYFEEFVRANHTQFLKLLDGAEDMILLIQSMDIPMGIVSNKSGEFIRQEITYFGWDSYFQSVVCSSEAPRDKPAPDPLLLAIKQANITDDPHQIWYIGDTATDMECAHKAGCVPIFIGEYEKTSAKTQEFPPFSVIQNYAALQQFLLQCA